MMSIMILPPLTTMICMSPEFFRASFISGSKLFFCQRMIPERIFCHFSGNRSESFSSNQIRSLINTPYDSGGVFWISKALNCAYIPLFHDCFSAANSSVSSGNENLPIASTLSHAMSDRLGGIIIPISRGVISVVSILVIVSRYV